MRESFLAGEEGVVALRVLVRSDGSVGDMQIAESSGSMLLDRSAQDAVKDWRYQPAMVNGAAVDAWVPVNIVWALQTLRFDLSPAQAKNMTSYWPAESLRDREVGTTTVRFLVLPDGTVAKVLIDGSSGHPRLDAAAVTMMKTGFRFSPAMLTSGERVGAWFRLSIDWAISGVKGKDDDPCRATTGTVSLDSVIQACTQSLLALDLTRYQRAIAYESRGRAHFFKDELDPAIADFNAGIRISPGLAILFIGRANSHFAKGDSSLALSDFDSAAQVEPLSYQPYLARAEAYFRGGQQDRAAVDFQSAMRVPTANLPALLNSGCGFLSRIGRAQDGLADCDKSLSLRPNDAATLQSRGYTYFKLEQYQRAIQDYDAALGVNARMAVSLYGRGVAKLKLGNAKGNADIEAAKAIDPTISNRMAKDGVIP